MRGADGDQDVGADHAVGAEHADLEVGDVHGAALAVAGAALAAEQLAHHGERVGALGDGVAVAAVGGEQDVGSREIGAHADRHRLLADGGMDGTEHELLLEALERRLLEGANAQHGAVVAQEPRRIEIARRRPGVLGSQRIILPVCVGDDDGSRPAACQRGARWFHPPEQTP